MACCSCCGERKPKPVPGTKESRSCTDCLCLLVWLIFTAAWVFVSVMAFTYGNTDWVLYGMDYEGNVCSKESATTPNVTDLADNNYGKNWTSRKLIWYPLDTDLFTAAESPTTKLQTLLKLGICVDACPVPNGDLIRPTKVKWYSEPREWNVWYASSTPILNRCIPDLQSNLTTPVVRALAESFIADTGIGSLFQYLEAELLDGIWVMVIGIGTGVVLCFVWIFFLKFTVTFFVHLVLLIVLALFTGGSVLLFWRAEYIKLYAAQDDPWQSYIIWFQIGGGILGVFAIIFLLLIIFMWRRIQVAIQILKLSADVITTTPTILIIPVLAVILITIDVVYSVFVGITLYSAGEVVPDNFTISAPWLQPVLNTTNQLLNSGVDLTNGLNLTNATVNITGIDTTAVINTSYIKDTFNFKLLFQLFNLFEFLWAMGLVNAIAFMTMAFVTVMYYFSVPGDGKKAPIGATFTGLWWTLRYHLGTVAMGSFIIAVIQLIRIIASYIQSKVEQSQNDAAKWIGRCIQCYLACLERIVTWINKNAYIICCIESSSFCSSAATAVGLLLSNLADVSAANFIADAIFIFCKICITGLNVAIMYGLFQTGLVSETKVLFLPLILGGFISWTLASVFMHVYDAVQDTALMCYCWDKENNNGSDEKPYYFNSRLQSILNKYNEGRDHKGRSTRKVHVAVSDPGDESAPALTPDKGPSP